MCANHNDLPAFLAQIPRKESLCVSRTLGATILEDNCSTARSTQSRTSKMIIDTARITYEMDGVMKLQLDLESVPVTHWRIVCHALRRISESVVSWIT